MFMSDKRIQEFLSDKFVLGYKELTPCNVIKKYCISSKSKSFTEVIINILNHSCSVAMISM